MIHVKLNLVFAPKTTQFTLGFFSVTLFVPFGYPIGFKFVLLPDTGVALAPPVNFGAQSVCVGTWLLVTLFA